MVAAAEEAGFDTVFTAEAWGSDAYTPLAWWGRETSRMRLGTSVVQLSARTPTACAMAALTLDHLSGGRHILGLGVSGTAGRRGLVRRRSSPSRWPAPASTSTSSARSGRAKRPVPSDGPHYPLPLTGEGTTGLGKTLKPITHPLRADIPIMLGAEGPKNVALAAEICDGWLPIFYSPADRRHVQRVARRGLRAARARAAAGRTSRSARRPGRRHRRPRAAIMELMKPHLALYMGGMGAEDTNFHADVYRRMGYAEVVDDVTTLFRTDRKDEAAKVIPDELVDDSAIVGDLDYVQEQIKAWEAAGVTMMVVGGRGRRADPRPGRAGVDAG